MALRRSLVVALLLGILGAFPAVTAAAAPISVNVITGSSCIDGSGPRNAPVIATLRTPGGHLRGRFRTQTDDQGRWAGCFVGVVNGRDRLHLAIGSRDRSLRIPRIEPQIDRVTDTITGFAPAESVVFASITHTRTFRDFTDHTLATQADANGNYTFDTTGEVDLRGSDTVIVFAPSGDDTFGALVFVPHMNVMHANNQVTGSANNGTDLVLVLLDRHGTVKSTNTAGSLSLDFGISLFVVNLHDDNGQAEYPVDTNRLGATLADDALIRMPVSSLMGDASTDIVAGRCMANAPYALQVVNEAFFGRTDGNGRFTRDVGNRMNLRRGDPLQLMCLYPTGDTWARVGMAL